MYDEYTARPGFFRFLASHHFVSGLGRTCPWPHAAVLQRAAFFASSLILKRF
jgi:hypothetical protein